MASIDKTNRTVLGGIGLVVVALLLWSYCGRVDDGAVKVARPTPEAPVPTPAVVEELSLGPLRRHSWSLDAGLGGRAAPLSRLHAAASHARLLLRVGACLLNTHSRLWRHRRSASSFSRPTRSTTPDGWSWSPTRRAAA